LVGSACSSCSTISSRVPVRNGVLFWLIALH
jgi:hypothetical protein